MSRLDELDNWAINGSAISKTFEFTDFNKSIDFVNKISEIAEKHAHHPDITVRYNIVILSLVTHSENSVTEKDFELAKEIDKL